jgi:hypothetical protein
VTKEQFIRKRADFESRDRRFNAIYLALFFIALFAAIPLSAYIPGGYEGAFAIGYLALLIANAAIFLLYNRNQAARAGLICANCKGGLLNMPGQIAVATGTCPHCGQPAFTRGA